MLNRNIRSARYRSRFLASSVIKVGGVREHAVAGAGGGPVARTGKRAGANESSVELTSGRNRAALCRWLR